MVIPKGAHNRHAALTNSNAALSGFNLVSRCHCKIPARAYRPRQAKKNTVSRFNQLPVINGVNANRSGTRYRPFAIFHDVRPVRIGLVPAIAAAVKATRQTGGVTLLSCDSQKIMRCALSSIPTRRSGSSSSVRTSCRISAGISVSARNGSPPKRSTTAWMFAGRPGARSASSNTAWLIRSKSAGAARVASTI